jgi:hypothetical protein
MEHAIFVSKKTVTRIFQSWPLPRWNFPNSFCQDSRSITMENSNINLFTIFIQPIKIKLKNKNSLSNPRKTFTDSNESKKK